MAVFLLTDIEKSTRLWEDHPEAMKTALERHDTILCDSVKSHGGTIVKNTGDGIFAVFEEGNPLACALHIQKVIQYEDWGELKDIRVRMALHSGTAQKRENDYFGSEVNKTARLLSAGWGGQILLSSSALETCGIPAGASIEDLDVHMLKDLEVSIRVFSLTHPDLILKEFPPLKTLSNRPNNLPPQITPFIGRKREIAELTELLSSKDCRFVTITGIGGIGKTRLALQAASELLEEFRDGVFFVPLAGISDPDRVVPAIAGSLKLIFTGREDSSIELLNFLKNKSMLLVLDNFEHIQEASFIISDILHSTNTVKILVTSRSLLHLTGEHTYMIEGLELPPHAEEASPSEYSSIELFLESMRRHNPSVTADDDDLQQIMDICQSISGVPLGIELAAAWVRVLSFREILSEIKKNLDLLSSETRDFPGRHRSIRTVFEYSWNILDESDKNAFRDISIFRGGFTKDAAEKVAGISAFGLLSLMDKSLLRKSPDGRFEIHELLREYARERAEENPARAAEMLKSHSEYYGRLLQKNSKRIRGIEASDSIEELTSEMNNIAKALNSAIDSGSGDLLMNAIPIYTEFMIARGFHNEACALLHRAAEAFSGTDNNIASHMKTNEAIFLMKSTYYEEAAAIFEKHLEIFSTQGDEKGKFDCEYGLGGCFMRTGKLDDARNFMQQSLKTARSLGDKRMIAKSLLGMGDLENHARNSDEAVSALSEAADLFTSLEDYEGIVATAVTRSDVLLNAGYLDEADLYSNKALMYAEKLGNMNALTLALSVSADTSIMLGEMPKALSLARRAAKLYSEQGSKWGLQISLMSMAQAQSALDLFEDAEVSVDKVLAVTEEIGLTQNSAETYRNAGDVLQKLNKPERALNSYLKGIEASETLGITYLAGDMKKRVAVILSSKKEFKKAKAILLDAIQKCLETRDESLMTELISVYMNLSENMGEAVTDAFTTSSPSETARAILELNKNKSR